MKNIIIYYESNLDNPCPDAASVWIQALDGPYQDLERDGVRVPWHEHPHTYKVAGPIEGDLAGQICDALAEVFKDLGHEVKIETTADD